METFRHIIEWVSLSIEGLAVLVIVLAILTALHPSTLRKWRREQPALDTFSIYKQSMGRGLLLALELLLAADVIATVALTPTLEALLSLGILALIRTFLSWSLEMEISGRWPWQGEPGKRATQRE